MAIITSRLNAVEVAHLLHKTIWRHFLVHRFDVN